MIMGYNGDSRVWFRQIPGLSEEYRVVAFDSRGNGRSDKPDVPYTMEIFAHDLAGLLNTLSVDAAHIYGISMGGMIAQEFALRYPDRVISLILGCTSCGGTHSTGLDEETMTFLLDMERMERLTPEEQSREWLPFDFSRDFIDNNPDIVEQYIAMRVECSPPLQSSMRQAEAIMLHDTYERLPQIKAPTLIIAGTGDRLVAVDNSRLLASRIPNAQLVLLEKVGHAFFVEAADKANKIILDFLGQHPRLS